MCQRVITLLYSNDRYLRFDHYHSNYTAYFVYCIYSIDTRNLCDAVVVMSITCTPITRMPSEGCCSIAIPVSQTRSKALKVDMFFVPNGIVSVLRTQMNCKEYRTPDSGVVRIGTQMDKFEKRS